MNELDDALQALVPVGVCASAAVVAEVVEPVAFAEEGQHLVDAVSARRNEFIGGRRCARAALADLGQAAVALPADADGVPVWPSDVLGSISHSRGLCCAVAANAAVLAGLGLDLEKTNRLSSRAMERVVHAAEAAFVGESQRFGSLLFSAKEAFFKAQYPVWGAQPNFKDLAFQIDSTNQALAVVEVADYLPETLRTAATRMQFRYRFFGDYVVTLCWLMRP